MHILIYIHIYHSTSLRAARGQTRAVIKKGLVVGIREGRGRVRDGIVWFLCKLYIPKKTRHLSRSSRLR